MYVFVYSKVKLFFKLRKIRQYETLGEDNTHVNFEDLDKISDENFKTGKFAGNLPTGKIVEKNNIIRGNLKNYKEFFI